MPVLLTIRKDTLLWYHSVSVGYYLLMLATRRTLRCIFFGRKIQRRWIIVSHKVISLNFAYGPVLFSKPVFQLSFSLPSPTAVNLTLSSHDAIDADATEANAIDADAIDAAARKPCGGSLLVDCLTNNLSPLQDGTDNSGPLSIAAGSFSNATFHQIKWNGKTYQPFKSKTCSWRNW